MQEERERGDGVVAYHGGQVKGCRGGRGRQRACVVRNVAGFRCAPNGDVRRRRVTVGACVAGGGDVVGVAISVDERGGSSAGDGPLRDGMPDGLGSGSGGAGDVRRQVRRGGEGVEKPSGAQCFERCFGAVHADVPRIGGQFAARPQVGIWKERHVGSLPDIGDRMLPSPRDLWITP